MGKKGARRLRTAAAVVVGGKGGIQARRHARIGNFCYCGKPIKDLSITVQIYCYH